MPRNRVENRVHHIINPYIVQEQSNLFKQIFIRLLNSSHTSNHRRSTFAGLNAVARNTILDDSVREIVMMLEDNVLAKFKLSPGLQRLEQRELMEIGE